MERALVAVIAVLIASYFGEGKKYLVGAHWFSGRRSRLRYLKAVALSLFEIFVLTISILYATDHWPHLFGIDASKSKIVNLSIGTFTTIEILQLLLIAVILFYECIFLALVSAQRCRDFGWTGWSVLLSILPVVGILFSFAIFLVPGNVGDNRYGPDPLS